MTDTGTRGDPGAGQGKADQAKEQAQEMAGQAREQAEQVKAKAGDRARGMVDERTTQAGDQLQQQVDDVRTVAQTLREQGKEGPAKAVEQAAERAERVSSYLRDSDGDRILSDVERVARQNPWAVVAGGVALGFAASRFLKASSRKRYESSADFDRYGTRGQLPRTTSPSTAGTGVEPGRARPAEPAVPPADTAGVAGGSPTTRSPVGSV